MTNKQDFQRTATRVATGASLLALVLAALLPAAGCSVTDEAETATSEGAIRAVAASPSGTSIHLPGQVLSPELDRLSAGIEPSGSSQSTQFAPHLSYFGGKVVENANVFKILYGSGSYIPEVTATSGANMATAYAQMMSSGVFDWLTEYNTLSPFQAIGRGSFGGSFSISPASSHNGSSITDASIQAELAAQINVGSLPAPTNNSVYMVHFPAGKSITSSDGSKSCAVGGFCAYHGTFKIGSQNVYYGVLPDLTGSCANACGTALTTFQNQQSVASHELVETITDAEVGLATVIGPPLAWYDANLGEIGDICNAKQSTFVGSDGATYTIQQEFSNLANACITTRDAPRNAGEKISGDFDGDGKSDVLWRGSDGTVSIWFMNGATRASTATFANPGLQYTIQGVGDFDGDGKTDVLWRAIDGTVSIWFMNGATHVSTAAFSNPGLQYTIQRVGDFDGDGKSDILWRGSDGAVSLWFMNGGTHVSTATFANPGLQYTIQGVGDFDGDGKSDILWRGFDGTVSIWFMNGGARGGTATFTNPGLQYTIQGVGDFDGDGKRDILWRGSDGIVSIWFMNGATHVSTGTFANPGLQYTIQGAGDFDGGGNSDILWRGSDGIVSIWFMNGGTHASTAAFANPGLQYTIQ